MLTIGKLGQSTGTRVQTIRYYEDIGLMPKPERTEGGQRRYRESDLNRLAFIRHARQLGFPLDTIRELLGLSDHPTRSCDEVDAIVRSQLRHVKQRIARLEALRTELERMVEQCSGGRMADCRVLDALRDHSEWLTEHEHIAA